MAIDRLSSPYHMHEGIAQFPQTSTMFQWYELEEFEAYRHLGYLMGWAYLSPWPSMKPSFRQLRPVCAITGLQPATGFLPSAYDSHPSRYSRSAKRNGNGWSLFHRRR